MNRKGVLFAGGVESVATRVDGTVKVTIGTQELNAESMTRLFSLLRQTGMIYVSPDVIDNEAVEIIDKHQSELEPEYKAQAKTPSQRLRNILYIYWEQNSKQDSFDDFYKNKIEEIINHYKSKLD